MGISKIEYYGDTLIDLTSDTVTPSDVMANAVFHSSDGEERIGTFSLDDEIAEQNDIIEQMLIELMNKTLPPEESITEVFYVDFSTANNASALTTENIVCNTAMADVVEAYNAGKTIIGRYIRTTAKETTYYKFERIMLGSTDDNAVLCFSYIDNLLNIRYLFRNAAGKWTVYIRSFNDYIIVHNITANTPKVYSNMPMDGAVIYVDSSYEEHMYMFSATVEKETGAGVAYRFYRIVDNSVQFMDFIPDEEWETFTIEQSEVSLGGGAVTDEHINSLIDIKIGDIETALDAILGGDA